MYSKQQVNRAGRVLRDGPRHHAAIADFWGAVDAVDWWRSRHARPLARVNANLRYYVRKWGVEPQVTQRLKRFGTIVDKLRRQPTMALTTMEDIGGVRAILPQQSQVDDVVRDLGTNRAGRSVAYANTSMAATPAPSPTAAEPSTLSLRRDGCFVEIQLRTPWQDLWAQSVEQDTRRLAQGLKFGAGPPDLRDYYEVVSEYLAMRENHQMPSVEFMQELAKLYTAARRYFPEAT